MATRSGGPAHTAGVDPHRAELSSANTTLDDLVRRVSSAGERLLATGDEALAHDLFEVERSLRAAQRRLAGVVGRMGAG
jgi:chromosome segregation ATPase